MSVSSERMLSKFKVYVSEDFQIIRKLGHDTPQLRSILREHFNDPQISEEDQVFAFPVDHGPLRTWFYSDREYIYTWHADPAFTLLDIRDKKQFIQFNKSSLLKTR